MIAFGSWSQKHNLCLPNLAAKRWHLEKDDCNTADVSLIKLQSFSLQSKLTKNCKTETAQRTRTSGSHYTVLFPIVTDSKSHLNGAQLRGTSHFYYCQCMMVQWKHTYQHTEEQLVQDAQTALILAMNSLLMSSTDSQSPTHTKKRRIRIMNKKNFREKSIQTEKMRKRTTSQ